jgi:hypothetical protein
MCVIDSAGALSSKATCEALRVGQPLPAVTLLAQIPPVDGTHNPAVLQLPAQDVVVIVLMTPLSVKTVIKVYLGGQTNTQSEKQTLKALRQYIKHCGRVARIQGISICSSVGW